MYASALFSLFAFFSNNLMCRPITAQSVLKGELINEGSALLSDEPALISIRGNFKQVSRKSLFCSAPAGTQDNNMIVADMKHAHLFPGEFIIIASLCR